MEHHDHAEGPRDVNPISRPLTLVQRFLAYKYACDDLYKCAVAWAEAILRNKVWY